MTSAPGGWYPDPEVPGQQRYWDGSGWTEHRAPGSGQWATAAQQTPGDAVAALVCGILSVVGCTFFTGIPAIVMGNRAKRAIRASGGVLGGEGLATAGVVTGWIGSLIVGVPLLIVLVFALAGAVSASMG
jgi:hypothetical protein